MISESKPMGKRTVERQRKITNQRYERTINRSFRLKKSFTHLQRIQSIDRIQSLLLEYTEMQEEVEQLMSKGQLHQSPEQRKLSILYEHDVE